MTATTDALQSSSSKNSKKPLLLLLYFFFAFLAAQSVSPLVCLPSFAFLSISSHTAHI